MVFLTQPVIEEFVSAEYRYEAHADFNESGGVCYRLLRGPSWLSVDPDSGVVTGTAEKEGEFAVIIEAYDDAGETARQAYRLYVLAVL